ncbi:hypothetical protein ABZS68_24965 [Streptomyces sp. NPDC005571]|uniref:hypothetical protein n=1 Tax=unclassified Streptomyces TaxID=2593676 RepID=UPI0033AA7B73
MEFGEIGDFVAMRDQAARADPADLRPQRDRGDDRRRESGDLRSPGIAPSTGRSEAAREGEQ